MAIRRYRNEQRSPDSDEAMAAATMLVVTRAVRAGASLYVRERDLPGLVRLNPFMCSASDSLGNAEAIIARLECALRAERKRARAGHWTYDLNRHIALRQALLAESERLSALGRR
jgi:hypothetical protein